MNSVIRNSSVVLLAMLLLTTSMTSARSYPMQDDDQAEEIRDERGFGSLVDFFHDLLQDSGIRQLPEQRRFLAQKLRTSQRSARSDIMRTFADEEHPQVIGYAHPHLTRKQRQAARAH